MHMTSKNTSKSGPKVEAKFHDGMWLVLRMKCDDSIIGRRVECRNKNWEEAPRGSKMVCGRIVEHTWRSHPY